MVANISKVSFFSERSGLRLKKGNHPFQELSSSSHDVDECSIGQPISIVLPNRTASEYLPVEGQHSCPLTVLAHPEFRNELESVLKVESSRDSDRERTFSIGESTEVGLQPSLLIIRTDRFVTAHVSTLRIGCDEN